MPRADSHSLAARLVRVRELLRERTLDGLIITALPNIYYLTNFDGSSATVVVTPDEVHFITDARYVTTVEALARSEHGVPGLRLTRVDTSYDEALAGLISAFEIDRIGFEAQHMSVARYRWLASAIGTDASEGDARLVEMDRGIERFRIRKDAQEIETLRVAARMLSGVAEEVLPEVGRGRAERDIAAEIDDRLHRAGFERPAFDTIVASGPNSGLPHAHPGARRLETGDLVVLDFGGVYDGYCVDLTRMVGIGTPDDEAARWHAAVLAAHGAAIAAVRPGVLASDVDAAARGTLAQQGLAEAFGHGTGHGLGIEVHEEPRISRPRPTPADGAAPDTRAVLLEPGMVFTIEPGVYFPDRGGVRIEDDVLVTKDGCEVLTDVSRALVVNQ